MQTKQTPLARLDLDYILSPERKRSEAMERVWQAVVAANAGSPDPAKLPVAEARLLRARQSERWNVNLPDVRSADLIAIEGTNGQGPITCELVVPHGSRDGCIVYCHGGGWAFGDLKTYARAVRVLANETKCRVLSVAYRLAPEHVFPAALDDAVAAWRWAVAQSRENPAFNGPLATAGDSAGATLALATAFVEIDRKGRIPDLMLLFYGVLNDDFDRPSYRLFGDGRFALTRSAMAAFWDWYAPTPDLRRNPLVVPCRASPSLIGNLPPLYLNASGLDPLLSDTLDFAALLDAGGKPYGLTVHDGVHHGFMQMTNELEEARRAFALAGSFFTANT